MYIRGNENEIIMTTVTVKMFDELNQVNIERTIDGSNLLVNDQNAAFGWESDIVGNDKQIESNLNLWIEQRANEQHDTILTLKGWEVNS